MATTVWRGYISFGLISIPVRLFRAARSERVSLRQVYRVPAIEDPVERSKPAQEAPREPPARLETFAPIHRAAVEETRQEIVPETEVVKGYEFDRGRFVTLAPEELKGLEPKTATEMELQEFVHLEEVDPIYFETSYYVRPDSGGEKPYALLYEALKRTKLVAVGRFAMHRREHVTIVRAARHGLVAHTMFFNAEVRADQEYRAETSLVNEKELQLAESLVRALADKFAPEKYHDTYKQRLEELIAAKVAGQPISSVPSAPRRAEVVDIMASLQASLAQLKKPPAAVKAKPAPAKAKEISGGRQKRSGTR
jgi:DNA end-binding protein Ku